MSGSNGATKWIAIACLMAVANLVCQAKAEIRCLFNDGWRFQAGDPLGAKNQVAYDLLPPPKDQMLPNEELTSTTYLKPWILPSANPFIKDPNQRHLPPAADLQIDLPFVKENFDDSRWQAVVLPHDWAIQGPFLTEGNFGGMGRLKTWGPAWYRKKFELPNSDERKSIYLDIDGAMSYATVWLNGKLVGGWPYGYASWRVELTKFLHFGTSNQLAIRLDSPPESSRWYPGAGLYRNVWLVKANPIHVAHWGTTVTASNISKAMANLNLQVAVDNDYASTEPITVSAEIFKLDALGRKLRKAVSKSTEQTIEIRAKDTGSISFGATVKRPELWGPAPEQKPNRYLAVVSVKRNNEVIDESETTFGIRAVTFDPNQGVLVNGQHIQLKGVNDHHDLGALGAAFNLSAARRQLTMMQEMGVNALRMSHNPPDPQLLDLADQMGFLVIDEIFDCWQKPKNPYDFHLIFDDWHEPDLRAFLRRDRNHPSVFLWSIGNEVGEQFTGDEGAKLAKGLVDFVREEDPTRPTMTAMNWSKPERALPGVVDVISLNYQGVGIRNIPGNFPAFHSKFPNKVLLSSESAAAVSSRGDYQFPVPNTQSAPVKTGIGGDPVTQEVSAYELFAADFGSSADKSFAAHEQNPYVAGEFVWTGWDYIGEPTPYYGARSSYFGVIDLAGFPKDRFYLYQAHWRPDLPMAHILPHWTWPERVGQVTPVHVFTSGDEAELFINGKSQGRKKKAPFEYRLRWDDVVYQPGEVRVVAYKNGKVWATTTERTAGAAYKLECATPRKKIDRKGTDLAFITVRVFDRNGILVPRAKNELKFSIDGPGEIVATDNGDPTSFVPFASHQKVALNGLCLVIVRPKPGSHDKITLHVESDSLKSTSLSWAE